MNTEGVRWILAPNPSPMTLDGTRTYIVGRRQPVVIDPGPAIPGHVRRVLEALDGIPPVAILCTHAHADHAGAGPELASETGAAIVARLDTLARGGSEGADSGPPGDVFTTDAGSLQIVPTPGHTPDHVSVRWIRGGGRTAAFVGDLLLGQGDTTFVGLPEGDLDGYLSSLDLVESWNCEVVYPAHGPPRDAREAIRRHREHKLQRIEQVRRLLEADPTIEADRLVDLIYGRTLEEALRMPATASVRAIAEFLVTRLTGPARGR